MHNFSEMVVFFQIRGKEDNVKDDKEMEPKAKPTTDEAEKAEDVEKNYKKKLSFRCDGKALVPYFCTNEDHHMFLNFIYEPRCEKIGFLHMRKQRRRSAAQ